MLNCAETISVYLPFLFLLNSFETQKKNFLSHEKTVWTIGSAEISWPRSAWWNSILTIFLFTYLWSIFCSCFSSFNQNLIYFLLWLFVLLIHFLYYLFEEYNVTQWMSSKQVVFVLYLFLNNTFLLSPLIVLYSALSGDFTFT